MSIRVMRGEIAFLGRQIGACKTANLAIVQIAAQSDKLVESRDPRLCQSLLQRADALAQCGVGDVQQIGDLPAVMSGQGQ